MKKLTVLFEGWYDIPHSYAIIMAFKIVHLYLKHSDNLVFYKRSMPYYNPSWKKQDVLPIKYKTILDSIKELPSDNTDIHIDLIYSVTFPYNLQLPPIGTKKCVFYTSEFRTLNSSYFSQLQDKSFTDLWFTGPSRWSICGLESQITPSHNKLISHGVDENIFYKDTVGRKQFRKEHNIDDDTIVFLNIGSMTGNKNIISVIIAFLHIILDDIKNDRTIKYRLVLKGSDSLYGSSKIIEHLVSQIEHQTINIPFLLEKYVIFIYDTLTYDQLRTIYSGCDVYVGPYLAEGFSLTHLESLFCSLRIVVPSTGATEDYIKDLVENDPSTAKLIYQVPSTVIKNNETDQYSNSMDINDIIKTMLVAAKTYVSEEHDTNYLIKKYSWSSIADELYEYFNTIVTA